MTRSCSRLAASAAVSRSPGVSPDGSDEVASAEALVGGGGSHAPGGNCTTGSVDVVSDESGAEPSGRAGRRRGRGRTRFHALGRGRRRGRGLAGRRRWGACRRGRTRSRRARRRCRCRAAPGGRASSERHRRSGSDYGWHRSPERHRRHRYGQRSPTALVGTVTLAPTGAADSGSGGIGPLIALPLRRAGSPGSASRTERGRRRCRSSPGADRCRPARSPVQVGRRRAGR